MTNHWLLAAWEASKRLGATRGVFEDLQAQLLAIKTPGGAYRYPVSYLDGLNEFSEGRRVTPALAQAFAATRRARELEMVAKERFAANVQARAKNGQLTAADIAELLNVGKMAVSCWKKKDKLIPRSLPGQRCNTYAVEEFLAACPWQHPGR